MKITRLLEELNKDDYVKALKDLQKQIKSRTSPLSKFEIVKMYYQKALKMGIDNKIIDDKLRRKINKHNKQIGKLDKSIDSDFDLVVMESALYLGA